MALRKPEQPQTILVESLSDPRFILRVPILLEIEHDDGGMIVSETQFNLYGAGPTIAAAVADYEDSLIEYYENLSRDPDQLSHRLNSHLVMLQSLLQMTP